MRAGKIAYRKRESKFFSQPTSTDEEIEGFEAQHKAQSAARAEAKTISDQEAFKKYCQTKFNVLEKSISSIPLTEEESGEYCKIALLEKGFAIDQAYQALRYFLDERKDIRVMSIGAALSSNQNNPEQALILQRFNKQKYSVFNVPIRGGNHAAYVIFDKSKRIFYYFDPDSDQVSTGAQGFLTRLATLAGYESNFEIRPFPKGTKQQAASWTCQILGILNVLDFFSGSLFNKTA